MPRAFPWVKFWPADWLNDSNLARCSAATQGRWMAWLCHMHLSDRSGELIGTADDFAALALGRCTAAEAVAALVELRDTGAADVEQSRDGAWSLVNRRMLREYKKRMGTAARVARHREKNVTRNGEYLRGNGDSNTSGQPTELWPQTQAQEAEPATGKPAQSPRNAPSNAQATPERQEARSLTPLTPHDELARELVEFLHAKDAAAGGPPEKELHNLLLAHGADLVTAEVERRASMRRPWHGLEVSPVAAMRSAILRGEKPAQPGAFAAWRAAQARRLEHQADVLAHENAAARARAFRARPRQERQALAEAFDAQVRPLRFFPDCLAAVDEMLVADPALPAYAEDCAAVNEWATTPEGRAVIAQGVAA